MRSTITNLGTTWHQEVDVEVKKEMTAWLAFYDIVWLRLSMATTHLEGGSDGWKKVPCCQSSPPLTAEILQFEGATEPTRLSEQRKINDLTLC